MISRDRFHPNNSTSTQALLDQTDCRNETSRHADRRQKWTNRRFTEAQKSVRNWRTRGHRWFFDTDLRRQRHCRRSPEQRHRASQGPTISAPTRQPLSRTPAPRAPAPASRTTIVCVAGLPFRVRELDASRTTKKKGRRSEWCVGHGTRSPRAWLPAECTWGLR